MTNHQTKEFDCITMKREAQSQIYEETKNMIPSEAVSYFNKAVQTSIFKEWWEQAGVNSKRYWFLSAIIWKPTNHKERFPIKTFGNDTSLQDRTPAIFPLPADT